MMKFEEQGISTYDRVLEALERLHIVPSFETPKHIFNILRKSLQEHLSISMDSYQFVKATTSSRATML